MRRRPDKTSGRVFSNSSEKTSSYCSPSKPVRVFAASGVAVSIRSGSPILEKDERGGVENRRGFSQ